MTVFVAFLFGGVEGGGDTVKAQPAVWKSPLHLAAAQYILLCASGALRMTPQLR